MFRYAPTVAQLFRHGRYGSLWRLLLIALGIRHTSPRPGELLPFELVHVEPADGDTGGAYRPKHRPQDPSVDPREPGGSESSSTGVDHGWANCSMSSGADAIAYATQGDQTPWGGDLRHSGQPDMDGGTDLYDVRAAAAELGVTFTVKSGQGWAAVVDVHEAGRAIVIQGIGNVPGSGTFDGGHACCIAPETRSSDGAWLWGDPTVSDWQWVGPGKIRDYAEAWQSSIAFGAMPKPPKPPEPEPEPKPPPAPPPPPPTYSQAIVDATAQLAVEHDRDVTVGAWVDWLDAPRPMPADAWDIGAWATVDDATAAELDGSDPCDMGEPAAWARGRAPYPYADAAEALRTVAVWDACSWRAALWLA